MKEPGKKFLRIFATVFVCCLLTVGCIFGIVALATCQPTYWCCVSTADITYVYENDSTENHYVLTRKLCDKTDYDTMDVKYTTRAGYQNNMYLVGILLKGNWKIMTEHNLFYVPDKRFKVVGIKETLTEKTKVKGEPKDCEHLNDKERFD
jgi:hypothetical protein